MAIPLPSPEISSAAKLETSLLASERELLACTVWQQRAAASTTSVAIDLFMMLLLREEHRRATYRKIIIRARSKRLGTSVLRFAGVPLRRWLGVGPRRGRRRRRPAERLGRRYQRGVHGVRQRRCNRGIRSIVAILLADILGHKCCALGLVLERPAVQPAAFHDQGRYGLLDGRLHRDLFGLIVGFAAIGLLLLVF